MNMGVMLPPEMQGPPGGGMGGAVPPELAGLLGGGQQPQPEAPPTDPLESLQGAIHSLVEAMHVLTDAQDVQDVSQALLTLSKIQTRLMGNSAPQAR